MFRLFSALSTNFYFLFPHSSFWVYFLKSLKVLFSWLMMVIFHLNNAMHIVGGILSWTIEIAVSILQKWPNINNFICFNLTMISHTQITVYFTFHDFISQVNPGSFYQSWPGGHVWISVCPKWSQSCGSQDMQFVSYQVGGNKWSSLKFSVNALVSMYPNLNLSLCVR